MGGDGEKDGSVDNWKGSKGERKKERWWGMEREEASPRKREKVIRERLQKEGLVDVYVYARIHPHYPATATTLPDLPTTADRITDRNSCTACMRLQGGRVLTVCYRDRAVFL
ncbi:Os04g0541366 [Oryza sativa Japonica Group]|uniref:Os04g0541366 protein n=1 Tax=Oryza sativa subsp. japonica TaxID=39947 RepID=A0A0P0WD02_ORYSJ|nr:Os04g0541366 [Oryza sativa Japonica Group]